MSCPAILFLRDAVVGLVVWVAVWQILAPEPPGIWWAFLGYLTALAISRLLVPWFDNCESLRARQRRDEAKQGADGERESGVTADR